MFLIFLTYRQNSNWAVIFFVKQSLMEHESHNCNEYTKRYATSGSLAWIMDQDGTVNCPLTFSVSTEGQIHAGGVLSEPRNGSAVFITQITISMVLPLEVLA